MLPLIQRRSLKSINLYGVKESGGDFTSRQKLEEGNQWNHWAEFKCMSIDSNYFALLSVIKTTGL